MLVAVHPDLIKTLEQGFASQQQGDLDSAEKKYLQVLRKDQRNEFALNLMGVLCIRTSRYPDAVSYLLRAIRANPEDAETHNNLGLAYQALNQFPDAQRAFEQSLKLHPGQPATLNNLGNIFAAIDQHKPAIACFESALNLDTKYVDCLNNLSVSLQEVGRLDHALQVIDRAIAIDGSKSMFFNNKGEILLRATQFESAKEAFDRAIELDGNLVAKMNLSTALKQLGDVDLSVEMLSEVIRQENHNSEAHNRLGVLLEQRGNTEQAAKHFRLALKHTPNHASSFYQLSKLKDQRLTSGEVAEIYDLLDDPQYLAIFKSSLFFALACEYEKRGDYGSSIDCLINAQKIKANRHPYSESATLEHLRLARQTFPIPRTGEISVNEGMTTPIFIVGMPRSGTTLAEQIISSHSAITGAGELGFINDVIKEASELTGKPYPMSMENLGSEQVQQLRESYLTRLLGRFGNGRFIVDKNPLNFNFIGAIAALFPDAKILYCKRAPMDNCVSIFKLPFDDNQGYSHDLAALGHFYLYHKELMKLWFENYSNQIMTVQYETTVAELEKQARRMLEFIGVEFEDQVLEYFNNERIVMTPSAEQVRQPIYSSSIDSWQKYGQALGPLIDALSGLDRA